MQIIIKDLEYELDFSKLDLRNKTYDGVKHAYDAKIKFDCERCGKETIRDLYLYRLSLCKKCKTRQSVLLKYGVESTFQVKEIKEKIRQTVFDKYGVENVYQSKEIIEKIKQTNLERYNDKNYRNIDKTKQTNIERYGITNTFQLPKTKETLLKNYGVDHNFKSIKIRNKIKLLFKEKYGVECVLSLETIKQKCKIKNLNKYGVEHYKKSVESKESIRNKLYDNLINGIRLNNLSKPLFF